MYDQEIVIPMDFIVSSLRISMLIELMHLAIVEKITSEIMNLEEDHFVVGFLQ